MWSIKAGHLLLPLVALAVFGFAETAVGEPKSGFELLPPEVQAMQDDLFANPGMFTVDEGRALFHAPGAEGKSCATCHGENGARLDRKRIARYPVFRAASGGVVTLQKQVDLCRENRVGEFPLTYDDRELVALETFVRHLARGEPVNVDVDGPLRPAYEAGKQLFHTRIGQLQMACYHCHELYEGARLRDQRLNQGQTNAFPAYRLLGNDVSSLHRKFRDCFATLRAMPFEPGSEEFVALEVFMSARGNGLPIETPGIRR
jgi:sulfur-oxidizing protein SoxA